MTLLLSKIFLLKKNGTIKVFCLNHETNTHFTFTYSRHFRQYMKILPASYVSFILLRKIFFTNIKCLSLSLFIDICIYIYEISRNKFLFQFKLYNMGAIFFSQMTSIFTSKKDFVKQKEFVFNFN